MTLLRRATPERLSAFSDGVFAVLITVLVLELRPPELPTFKALLLLWPTWLSYAVSYLFIAIVWTNHHYCASALVRTMLWKPAMISRASTSDGTPSSTAAMVTDSDLDRLSREVVMSRAKVRAEGVRAKLPASALSACRRRVAHSATTLADPLKPCALSCRQSAAPLRTPASHWVSSQGRCASNELCRGPKTSDRSPRMILRIVCRWWPVRLTICLIGTPSFHKVRIATLVSSRRR